MATHELLVNLPLIYLVLIPVFFVVPFGFADKHEKNNDKGNENEALKRWPSLGPYSPKDV